MTSRIKRIIGMAMIAAPFVGIFGYIAILQGFGQMLIFISIIAFCIGWLKIGVDLASGW